MSDLEDLGFEFGFKCVDTDLGRKLHFEEVDKLPVNRLSDIIYQNDTAACEIDRERECESE